MGAPDRWDPDGGRRPGRPVVVDDGPDRGQRLGDSVRVHRVGGADHSVLLGVVSGERSPSPPGGCHLRHRGHRAVVGGVGVAVHLPGRVPRGCRPVAHHPQGAHLRADRRHRGRTDHVAARGHRRRAQLGLPLLLAARRHPYSRGPHAGRVLPGGHGLARLAPARYCRGPLADADHVRRRGRAPPRRMGGRLAPGLRGLAPGADRKRGGRPVPTGRLWRGHVRALRVSAVRRPGRRCRLGAAAVAACVPRDGVA